MDAEKRRHTWTWLVLIFPWLLVAGCAQHVLERTDANDHAWQPRADTSMPLALGDIVPTDDGVQIVLTGTHPFSYNLANHDQPFHLTVDVPQGRVDREEMRTVGYGGVKTVQLSQAPGVPARLAIHLEDAVSYSVVKEQERLLVRVRTPQTETTHPKQPVTTSAMPTPSVSLSPPIAPPERASIDDYRVGPGDVLAITVYDEPDLTQQIRVSARGVVAFPLIGDVQVQGLTPSQIVQRLEKRLSPRYLLQPQVFAQVTEYASKKVFIVGAVDKPRSYAINGPTTLLDILAYTTDLDRYRSLDLSHSSYLTIFRRTVPEEAQRDTEPNAVLAIRVDLDRLLSQGDISLNLAMRPDDVIYIPKPDEVFVFGKVNREGPVAYPDGGITLAQAINRAGGFTDFAAPGRTRVLRTVNGKEQIIRVNMAAVIRGNLGKDIMLKANDIVMVPETHF